MFFHFSVILVVCRYFEVDIISQESWIQSTDKRN